MSLYEGKVSKDQHEDGWNQDVVDQDEDVVGQKTIVTDVLLAKNCNLYHHERKNDDNGV
jgi:hypothetical protein